MSEPLKIVLGIETSCDETAAAVVDSARRIRSNLVLSQLDEHRPYGGVVPEIAARSHLDHLDGLVERALEEAGVACADLDGVAATGGPGLIGGVFVGVMTAKAIAAASAKPFLSLSAAADLRRPLPAFGGPRCRPLRALRHHRRRRGGRGLRQDGEAARTRLSRRPGGGTGGG
jgi:hypothetical protein